MVIWAVIKLMILLGLGLLLWVFPGEMTIRWMEHILTVNLFLIFLSVLVLGIVFYLLYRGTQSLQYLWGKISNLPLWSKSHAFQRATEKTKTALILGDEIAAAHAWRDMAKLNPKSQETLLLGLLLMRSKALLVEDMPKWADTQGLSDGLKAEQAYGQRRYADVVVYAKAAALSFASPHMGRLWILSHVIQKQWDAAVSAVEELSKTKAFNKEERAHWLAQIGGARALQEGQERYFARDLTTAHDLDPSLLAVVFSLSDFYQQQGEPKKAQKILLEAWPFTHHWRLLIAFGDLKKEETPLEQYRLISEYFSVDEMALSQALITMVFAHYARLPGDVRHFAQLAHQQLANTPTSDWSVLAHLLMNLMAPEDADVKKMGKRLTMKDAQDYVQLHFSSAQWECAACRQEHTLWHMVCHACQVGGKIVPRLSKTDVTNLLRL